MNLLCNLKKIDAVAFDFDGTLVNCKTRQVEVLQSILRRGDINLHEFNTDEWWKYKTNGLNTFNALIEMQTKPETAEYISLCWKNLIENPEWLDLDRLFDGVIPLLKKLKKSEKNIYIITARKSEYFFLNQIKKLCIDQYIKDFFVVNPGESIEQKRKVLEQIKPSFFIGDTENDFYSATKAGIEFIAVSSGQRSKKFLTMKGIDFIINHISEICFSNN